MKRLLTWFLLLGFLTAAALAQYQGRLSSDDQRRFDSYYQRWLDYKRTNNRGEVASMEKRMQDVMAHYHIPSNTPYSAIASSGNSGNRSWGYDQYRGRFSADDQRRFDSYHQRWLDYKRTNNRDEIVSMEKRMQDVMQHYNIPLSVPYDVLASDYRGGNYRDRDDDDDRYYDRDRDRDRDHDRDHDNDRDHDWDRDRHREWDWDRDRDYDWDSAWSRWHGRLSSDDQSRFDSYYTRWIGYVRENDGDEIRSMEARMRDVMQSNRIPDDIPFDRIASDDATRGGYSDLRIYRASYGAGGRQADVTSRLRALAQDGRINLRVNNATMGNDPAPEAHKTLIVWYAYRGQRRNVTIREQDLLNLP